MHDHIRCPAVRLERIIATAIGKTPPKENSQHSMEQESKIVVHMLQKLLRARFTFHNGFPSIQMPILNGIYRCWHSNVQTEGNFPPIWYSLTHMNIWNDIFNWTNSNYCFHRELITNTFTRTNQRKWVGCLPTSRFGNEIRKFSRKRQHLWKFIGERLKVFYEWNSFGISWVHSLGGIVDESSASIVRMNECVVMWCEYVVHMFDVDRRHPMVDLFVFSTIQTAHTFYFVVYEIAWCVHSFFVIHLNYLNIHSFKRTHTHDELRLYVRSFLNDIDTNTSSNINSTTHIIIYGFTYRSVCYWRHNTLCVHIAIIVVCWSIDEFKWF